MRFLSQTCFKEKVQSTDLLDSTCSCISVLKTFEMWKSGRVPINNICERFPANRILNIDMSIKLHGLWYRNTNWMTGLIHLENTAIRCPYLGRTNYLATFSWIRFSSDSVHCNGNRLVSFSWNGSQRHPTSAEPLNNRCSWFNLSHRDWGTITFELKKISDNLLFNWHKLRLNYYHDFHLN